ncbi:hypothetical protein BEP19_02345 [Ammoniphilus oxalaticus]|uniref:Endonuclease NucS C-terminal domain-containing protein n=1 Tax=Ammoniphilus oxalaticus TaxID=66863 RepID=A0A419SNK1_9BACL|nr:endonuclease NucS domain-containing protein [Ammoniphilus oxalaticus]RKD25799.1 hypothetical protein BEP19_02345 [Ammoniphilus oxalaticus]
MVVLSEQEIEDIVALHPELIETGLTLLERQGQLENRRTDLMFKDAQDRLLVVELKKGIVIEADVDQIEDYLQRVNKIKQGDNRAMIIGEAVPPSIRSICEDKGIEWKEIKDEALYTYLQQHNPSLLNEVFFEEKLHEKAKQVETMSFHDYLQATTSPFGGPYSSYQFFKPRDASTELSDNLEANQVVADEIKQIILEYPFDRTLFHGAIRVKRNEKTEPRWEVKTSNGAWQGYVIDYDLYLKNNPEAIPCELYLGTIGYRGNPRAVYADETSRFIVLDIGKGKEKVSTQYGFHKYLRTQQKALFPFYELKFNAKGTPKENWQSIYDRLSQYGYAVRESDDGKSQLLWIGEIGLNKETTATEIANLIEALFAVTIVKSHFMREGRGMSFEFLEG